MNPTHPIAAVRRRPRSEAGFTLVEMLIAMAVMLIILGGVFQAFPARSAEHS